MTSSLVHTFRVWRPERRETFEDGQDYKEMDFDDAACEWAMNDDAATADYAIVGGRQAEVQVRNLDTREEMTMIVWGEAEPCYYAHKKKGTP